jgi:hypothetical protein
MDQKRSSVTNPCAASPILREFKILLNTLAKFVDVREAFHGQRQSMLGSLVKP